MKRKGSLENAIFLLFQEKINEINYFS